MFNGKAEVPSTSISTANVSSIPLPSSLLKRHIKEAIACKPGEPGGC